MNKTNLAALGSSARSRFVWRGYSNRNLRKRFYLALSQRVRRILEDHPPAYITEYRNPDVLCCEACAMTY